MASPVPSGITIGQALASAAQPAGSSYQDILNAVRAIPREMEAFQRMDTAGRKEFDRRKDVALNDAVQMRNLADRISMGGGGQSLQEVMAPSQAQGMTRRGMPGRRRYASGSAAPVAEGMQQHEMAALARALHDRGDVVISPEERAEYERLVGEGGELRQALSALQTDEIKDVEARLAAIEELRGSGPDTDVSPSTMNMVGEFMKQNPDLAPSSDRDARRKILAGGVQRGLMGEDVVPSDLEDVLRKRGLGGMPAEGAEPKGLANLSDIAMAMESQIPPEEAARFAEYKQERGRIQGEIEQAMRVGGKKGLVNPATKIGLPPSAILRSSDVTMLTELVRSNHPAAKGLLSSMGVNPDITVKDLTGLASEAQDYEFSLAGLAAEKVSERQAKRSELIDAGKVLQIKARLAGVRYEGDNDDELAKALSKLDQRAIDQAIADIGTDSKFSQQLELAKTQSNKMTRVITQHLGLPEKGVSGGTAPNDVKALQTEIAAQRRIIDSIEGEQTRLRLKDKNITQAQNRRLMAAKRQEGRAKEDLYALTGQRGSPYETASEAAVYAWENKMSYPEAATLLLNEGFVSDEQDAMSVLNDIMPVPVKPGEAPRNVWNQNIAKVVPDQVPTAVRIKNKEEHENLPSGTLYIGPDGKKGIKR